MVSLSQYEMECREIKQICDKYGHGNVMEWASALWRRECREKGYLESCCFVPTIPSFIKKRFQNQNSKQHEIYDTRVERVLGEKMEVKIVRLVDLDAVIDRLEVEVGYEGMREDLYSLPVIDVAPVVRCKDCAKHYIVLGRDMCARNAQGSEGHWIGLSATVPDGFCHRGVHK